MPERPNFYVLLDLDPQVRDWAALEERIRAKRDEWSQQQSQGHPNARARAEQCQRFLPELERCLRDPACRAHEAEQAAWILAQERQRRAKELEELIELIRGGGGVCDRERLARLARKFDGVFSQEEIESCLRRAGVTIEGEPVPAAADAPPKEIDRQLAREIRQRLDLLGSRDLYVFLGLPPGASPEELRARAAEIYPENRRLGRHDAVATAQNDLASHCETVFASPATKAAYDRYLTVEAMERLTERIDLAGADGLLTREEMEALVRKAVELGVERETARRYLESLARERGWKVDPGPAPRPEPASDPSRRPSRPEGDRLSRYVAFLMPHLRALTRRPAVAVPAGLTVVGMAAVLAASMGAPGPQAGAAAPATAQSAPPSASRRAGNATGAAEAPRPARSGGVAPPPGGLEKAATPQPQSGGDAFPPPAVPPASQRPSSPPAPPARALPMDPRLMVVAVGDDRVGPLIEDTLGRVLRGAGLEVHDNRGSLALADLLRSARGHPPLSEMARTLAGDGFDVLVLAEIDPIGRRQLEFYGRRELATTSRVRLHAYALVDQRALGSGWTDEIEYTERGAAQQVAKPMEAAGAALARGIADGWERRLAAEGERP